MRALGVFLCLLLVAARPMPTSAASPDSTLLRIGLNHDFAHITQVLVSAPAPFVFRDPETNRVLLQGAAGEAYKILPAPAGLTIVRADQKGETPTEWNCAAVEVAAGSGPIRIARLDSAARPGRPARWHRYRGTLSLRRAPDSTLQVVNTVDLESYLYGVIPAEIGSDAPAEAMKAQAVAARTYALKNRGKMAAQGYDLDDTTRCEGYLGMDGETAGSNAAVDTTRGMVLAYRGVLIDAPYSTDSGGMTACDPSCPYLQAVRDAPQPAGGDYAAGCKYHTWTQTFSAAQLQALLARDPRTRVAQFVSLTLDALDASGRITTATVAGADGTMKTVTGPQLRQILGYDLLRSTRVTLTFEPDGSYRFDGRGWGHGLGMSQEGAVAMASPPYRKGYREILEHYYVGTELQPAAALKLQTVSLPAPRRGA